VRDRVRAVVPRPAAGGGLAAIDRALGSTENIYWLLDKLYCLNFVVFAELDGSLDPARLAAAVAAVQDVHPLLRARIVTVDRRNWFKPVARAAAPLRPVVQGLRHWRREIERQLHAPFEPGQAPLARLLWFRGAAAKSVLAMTFHHAIADGRSGAAVLLQVLRHATVVASSPGFMPAQPSSQSLDVIRQKPPVLGALQGMRFWLARGRDALQFAQQLPGYDPTPAPDRNIKVLALRAAPVLAARLQAQARRHGTTVHGALAAAQLLAVNEQFRAALPRRLAINSLADLRGVLNGGLTDADLGLYITTLCTVHTIGTSPDFWSLAREVRDALKQSVDSGDANLIHGVYPADPVLDPDEGTARLVQAVVSLGPPSTMLTNIGRIDDVDLGDTLTLKALAFVVSPPAQHPICVTATGYRGRLFMHLLYDENKLSRGQARAMGESLMRRLAEACELPAGPGR
jgi:NRPS condensation-like uncharacterized protein